MTIQFDWVNANATGSRGRCASTNLVIKKNKGGTVNGVDRYSAAITIPLEVMKSARLVIGDRAIVGVAHDLERGRCLAIKRVVRGGHKIGPATTKEDKSEAGSEGKQLRGRIQMMWPEGMHEDFVAPSKNMEQLDDGTIVLWEGLQ